MILTHLSLTNFRCFDKFELDQIDRLAIFIGENDIGKTVILDAIEFLVSNKTFNQNDFHKSGNGTQADESRIEGIFQLEDHDDLPNEYRSGDGQRQLKLKKSFTTSGPEVFVWGQGFDDAEFDDFTGAEKQKRLLLKCGLKPESNEARRKEQLDELLKSGKLHLVEKEIKLSNFNAILSHLPRIERCSSSDYRSPSSPRTSRNWF